MATPIEIASNALVLIGDEPISSFDDPGAGATAAKSLYERTVRTLLSYHPWTFATKEFELNLLAAVPEDQSRYSKAFAVPADLIRILEVRPYVDYQIVGEQIHTNTNRLYCRYIFDVDTFAYPPYFQTALEYLLASDFAQLITESTNKADYFLQRHKDALASAVHADSQGHPHPGLAHNPFVDVRRGRDF